MTFLISCVKERVSAKQSSYINKGNSQNLGKQHHQYLKQKMYILQMLVDEVYGTNQLVESCKMYLSK